MSPQTVEQPPNGAPAPQVQPQSVPAPAAPASSLDQAIAETERRLKERLLLQREDFGHKQRLARLFAVSGCFQDIKTKNIPEEQAIAQAFVKIELGESMGFTAAESMQGVHLISGTPAVNAQLRAARMQRAGFSWEIDWFYDDKGFCTGCRLWLYRNGKPILKPARNEAGEPLVIDGKVQMEQVSVAFLRRDAERLMTKIWDQGDGKPPRTASVLEKDNWKNTPANMYFARAVTNAQRWYAPGVLSGDIPSTEEAMDFDPPINRAEAATSEQAEALKARLSQAQKANESEEGKPPGDGTLFGRATPAVEDPNDARKRGRR